MAAHIHHQLFFPHPPRAVWEFLTDSALMQQWLMPNDFKPVAGHEFTFRINPMPTMDFDGIVYCKVLEIVPFEKLSYTWKLGPGDGSVNIDSTVTFELQPKDNGTNLVLDHADFVVMKNAGIFNAMEKGWLENMHKMNDKLKG